MTEHHAATDSIRLRQHPADRAIGTSQVLDLAAALEQLWNEPHAAIHGHRQVTVFQQSLVTMVLFAFDVDGTLPNHVAPGIVTIHVLEGSLTVQAEDTDHVLQFDQILVLNPGIPHSVRASEASAMLLTVNMAGRDTTVREE